MDGEDGVGSAGSPCAGWATRAHVGGQGGSRTAPTSAGGRGQATEARAPMRVGCGKGRVGCRDGGAHGHPQGMPLHRTPLPAPFTPIPAVTNRGEEPGVGIRAQAPEPSMAHLPSPRPAACAARALWIPVFTGMTRHGAGFGRRAMDGTPPERYLGSARNDTSFFIATPRCYACARLAATYRPETLPFANARASRHHAACVRGRRLRFRLVHTRGSRG